MYKNDVFIKEYINLNNPNELKNKPILIDDFIGDELFRKEKYEKKTSEKIKRVLNTLAICGYNKIPLRLYPTILNLLLFHRMKIKEIESLYTKYVGNWGIKNVSYRFEGIKNNQVVKTVIKEEAKKVFLDCKISHTLLKEEESYDCALIRLKAVDQNHNILSYFNEAITIETTDNLEIIGSSNISFKGGMTGLFIKSKGIEGAGFVRIKSSYFDDVAIELKVLINRKDVDL